MQSSLLNTCVSNQDLCRAEQEFKESMLGYRLKKDRNINFLDYYQAYIDTNSKKDLQMMKIALNRFKDFLKSNISFMSSVSSPN